jgi:hypothetical protein
LKNFIGVTIALLLAANVGATIARTPAAHAAPQMEYDEGEFIVHDGRPNPLGPNYDAKKERSSMLKELNDAARKGWRVVGYGVQGTNEYSDHYFILERPKGAGAM